MAKELQLVKLKDPRGKELKYAILLKSRVVSRHRTLNNARKKFNKALRIAKGEKKWEVMIF